MHDVAFDELAFATGAAADGVVSDAVDVAEGVGGGLVEDGDGVGGEELLVEASGSEAGTDVFGGVVGGEGLDAETVGEPRMQGAVSAHDEALVEIEEADQDEGEQCLAVPGVVEQDVQVVEGVLVHDVSLVDEQDREGALASEVLDVFADEVEDIAGGRAVGDVEGVADVTVDRGGRG